jgi:hypothetical protein
MANPIETRLTQYGDIIVVNKERLRRIMNVNINAEGKLEPVPKWLNPASLQTLPKPVQNIFLGRGSGDLFAIPIEIQKQPKGILRLMQIPNEAKKWLEEQHTMYDIPKGRDKKGNELSCIMMFIFPDRRVYAGSSVLSEYIKYDGVPTPKPVMKVVLQTSLDYYAPQYGVQFQLVGVGHLLMKAEALRHDIMSTMELSTDEARKKLGSKRFALMALTGKKSGDARSYFDDPISYSEFPTMTLPQQTQPQR